MTDAMAVAATYFDAWQARDFARRRRIVTGAVTTSPFGPNSSPKPNGPALSQPSRG